MSDSAIIVENLSKKYIIGHQQEERYSTLRDSIVSTFKRKQKSDLSTEEFWALKDVSFNIKQGDRVGVIGRNGAGKSTLLKILSRITEPTDGRIHMHGRVASLLEVGTGFHPELTGRENVYLNGAILGMGKTEIEHKFDEIVAFAEVEKFLDTPVKRYSSGMYVRLAFAVAAHLEPEILIVDEVLAVGDAKFQKKCLGKMKDVGKEGRTVIFVSHNLSTIKQLCNHGIYLEGGTIKAQGAISQVMDAYECSMFGRKDQSLPTGVIYEQYLIPDSINFWITHVEILDPENRPKHTLATWDYVKFRVHYFARESVQNGSGILSVTTLDNTKLILCSTMPDRQVAMRIDKGYSYFDCTFKNWPLAAGQYLFQASLAIPMKEWLYQTHDSIPLTVTATDIFNSGMPPDTSRYIVAAPYEIESGLTSEVSRR